MRLCTTCQCDLGKRTSEICKKCYYKKYHLKNYSGKKIPCEDCGTFEKPNRTRRCETCREKIKQTCRDCKKEFTYRSLLKRCPKCQYHHYKKSSPESFEAMRTRRNAKINAFVRIKQGLPIDHVFHKGPKGEGYLNKKGYVLMVVKDSINKRYVRRYQHVLEMAKFLGRDLYSHERVHHKNGIRNDNRLENLELWSISQPPGQRTEDKIAWAREFLISYGYKIELKT